MIGFRIYLRWINRDFETGDARGAIKRLRHLADELERNLEQYKNNRCY